MKILRSLFVLSLALVFGAGILGAEVSLAAEPDFAPLINEATIKGDGYLELQRRSAAERAPRIGETSVSAYPGSSIIAIHQLNSASDSSFHETFVIHLVSSDSKEKIAEFYKGKLSGWKHEANDKIARDLFLEKGNQSFYGGKEPLEGMRVEIKPLRHEKAFDIVGGKVAEKVPSLETMIKVYIEVARSPLMAVNSEQVYKSCITKELEDKRKMLKGKNDPGTNQYLKGVAEQSCKKVQTACAKDANGGRCQGYARRYQS